ncbi:MAG: hypothetical protein R3E53_01960 [Myxococcota bacterium]
MSDSNHDEWVPPSAEALSDRLFAVSMVGVLSFIAIVFLFIL